jgi:gamma-glutamylcyclotransferase (GGCT)/AIG2-like uncharacterized protein YtfP
MTTRNVFTYGSLMFADVWTRVVVGRYRSVVATLMDHARFAVVEQSYPGMVSSIGAKVDGVLHLDVDEADVVRLDHFEGDDYSRTSIALICADGVTRDADTYVYRLADRLLPAPWDPDAFAMDHFIATYCRDKLGS